MHPGWRLLGAALWFFVATGCERKPPASAPPPASRQVFEVRGVVKSADAKTGQAVIAHEEIPAYMPAMTMEFRAARAEELAGFEPGDVVTFQLSVTDAESSIAGLRKVGRAAVPEDAAPPGLPSAGTPVPEVALLGDQGQAIRLSDFKGRAIAVTFIFTRCPLPDFCPLMNRNLAVVERELAALNASEKWHLLSVTIDPGHDTPARLAEYSKAYRADPARWTFATGDPAEIRKLGAFVGLAISGEGAALQHNLRTLVVDREGRLRRVFSGNEWKAGALVEEMRRAMRE
jgi:protein SCO1